MAESKVSKLNTGSESPQSSSFIGYYKGFSVTITKRDPEAKVKPLIDDAIAGIEYMLEKGFLPSWNKSTSEQALSKTPKQAVNDEGFTREPDYNGSSDTPDLLMCPIHHQTMKQMQGQYGTYTTHLVGTRPGNGGTFYMNCNGKTMKEKFKPA